MDFRRDAGEIGIDTALYDARPDGHPFFVFLNYYDAHAPWVCPEDPSLCFGLGALPAARRTAIDKKFLELSSGKPVTVDRDSEQFVNVSFDMYRDSYESCIAYLDRQVGLLLEELDRRGVLEKTLVIVTSDHGEHFGEHGLFGHGLSLYRREVHVPLLLIPPGRSSTAQVVNEPVSLREIPATVAAWAGLGSRNPFPGRSLCRFLGDGKEHVQQTSPVLCEVQHIERYSRASQVPSSLGPVRALVARERVYIRDDGGREELYSLSNDRLESGDLSKYPQSSPELDQFREELSRLCQGVTTNKESTTSALRYRADHRDE